MIFAFFLYVLLRGSEKPCFFIVFYNKVLKKSLFLAFFGQRLSVDLGPHGVMPSEILKYREKQKDENNSKYKNETIKMEQGGRASTVMMSPV